MRRSGTPLGIKIRYIVYTGSAVILRQCHLRDKTFVLNFAYAPNETSRARPRLPPAVVRSREREESRRG